MTKQIQLLGRLLCLSVFVLHAASAQQNSSRQPQMRIRPVGRFDAAQRALRQDEGSLALARARAAMAARQYDRAYSEYQNALRLLDRTRSNELEEARNGIAASGTALARERIAAGRASDAQSILSEVLAARPNYSPALNLLAPAAGPRPVASPHKLYGLTSSPPPASPPANPTTRSFKRATPPPVEIIGEGAPAPVPDREAERVAPVTTGNPARGGAPAAGGAPPPVGTAPVAERKPIVRVFFGTDRAPSGEKGPRNYFGSDRYEKGDHLITGYVNVSIPPGHKSGKVERPFHILSWELSEDATRHFVIKEIKRIDGDNFYSTLSDELGKLPSSSRSAFVFIHGYKVTFDQAAYRTAELAYDLNFPGVPIMYSWPSQAELLGYAGDLDNADLSSPHLQQFLQRIADESGATRIQLVAHSMGNRVLTGALDRMAAKYDQSVFDNVVMVAPDVLAEYFRQDWPQVQHLAKRFTLYASSDDSALLAAMKVRGGSQFLRLGQGGSNLVILDGLDSIDASGIDTSYLGHSYESCKQVLDDLTLLFTKEWPPLQRKLRDRTRDGLAYWVFP